MGDEGMEGGPTVAEGSPSRRLSICMLAACPFPANHGTPGSIREMAEAISAEGHDVHVVAYHIGEDIPVRGPTLHRIPRITRETAVVVGPTIRRPIYDLLMVFKAIQVVLRHRCDVIHAHGYEAALVAWICRLVTRRPVVYSGHNTMLDELSSYGAIRPRWLADGLAKVLDWFVPARADVCLPHSENIERFFHDSGLGRRTAPVVKFGIDLDGVPIFDRAEEARRIGLDGGPVVLYAGVMNEFQRLDLLLDAMRIVLGAEPRARLLFVVTIASERHLEDVRRRAEALGIADGVVLTGPQDLDGVWRHLAACDVAVVPRPGAPGFPIKLLNYMAARRACVMFASSASGMVDRESILLAAADTAEALAAGILDLLRDEALRDRVASGGHRFVRAHHDRRAIARQVVGSYGLALGEAGAGTGADGRWREAEGCPLPSQGPA